jgi:segregation and condensation protein A
MTAAPPHSASRFESSVSSEATYAVKLPIFEGPLDLLLHLIRLNEVEITDIPVARIAEQYVEYLDVMQDLNLDVAGEYLVMAATLAWIKSRMLLPPDPSEIADDGVDPRTELAARLVEYQRFKEVAAELGERSLLGRDVFESRGREPEPVPEAEREIRVGLFELVEAFRQALRREGPSGAAHEVEAETVTVRDCMITVMRRFGGRDTCEFSELLLDAEGRLVSRPVLVAIFLAMLELTRLEAVGIFQGVDAFGVPEGPIHLRRRIEPGDEAWAERISELM